MPCINWLYILPSYMSPWLQFSLVVVDCNGLGERCPVFIGYTYYPDICFCIKYVNRVQLHTNASDECRSVGGDLARIDTPDVQKRVEALLGLLQFKISILFLHCICSISFSWQYYTPTYQKRFDVIRGQINNLPKLCEIFYCIILFNIFVVVPWFFL